jgi:hypothetical protein
MAVVLCSELNLDACFEMKKPAQIEGDAPEGSVDHTHGIQHGPIDGLNILKCKTIKRILCSECAEQNADSLDQHTEVVTPVALGCTYSL